MRATRTMTNAMTIVALAMTTHLALQSAWGWPDESDHPAAAAARPAKGKQKLKTDASDDFFASAKVTHLKIVVPPAELSKLREDNRSYVRCELTENGKTKYQDIGLKLKGAAGSFREWDDRPALTLNVTKFARQQSFHNLNKFHLNNSVQDETYLNEMICADLFRRAGLPAPRVTHARVWLNDRDVGLYVLKEGFDRSFLRRYFPDASGNLYDGGFLQDIDVDLEKDAGAGPDDHSDLHALRDACMEPDAGVRVARLDELLNVEKFIDFMALELMTGHWDGYSQGKNNYRLYFDPQSKKAHFLAHGMDQMFGDAGASVLDFPGSIAALAVMQHRPWRAKYRERLAELVKLFSPPTTILRRIDVQQARLLPVIRELGQDQANAFKERIAELKQRITDRAENLRAQIDLPDPGPLTFDAEGLANLADWYPIRETEDAEQEQPEVTGGRATYLVKCGPGGMCIASWRRKVWLDKGRYQLEGEAMSQGITAAEEERGRGAGLRISGLNRTNALIGTTKWTTLQFEFEITEELREVELVAELRATGGAVWFDAGSLRLKKLAAQPAAN